MCISVHAHAMQPSSTPYKKKLRRHELEEMIDGGESLTVEFKRLFSSPEKMAKEMIAFANTKGGTLLVGVDDDGTVVGVQSEKSEVSELEHTSEFLCEPPVKVDIQIVNWPGGKEVVVVTVPESKEKPHTLVEYDASGKRIATNHPQG